MTATPAEPTHHNHPQPRLPRSPWPYLLALLVLAFVFLQFRGIAGGSLQAYDEGLTAERTRNMAEAPSFFPRQNGEARYQKPPLFYLVSVPSHWIFEDPELRARMPSAALALICFVLCSFFAWRRHGPAAACWTALLFCATPLWFNMTRLGRLESALGLCMLGLFLSATSERPRALLTRGLAFSCLALLVKGPIALLALLALAVLLPPRRYRWRTLWLFLAVTALWTLLCVWLSNGEYFDHHVRQNWVERVTERIAGHDTGLLKYFSYFQTQAGVLLLATLLVCFPRRQLDGDERLRRCLLLAPLLTLGFMSASQSKHEWHIVPLFPAMALGAGILVARRLADFRLWQQGLAFALVAALGYLALQDTDTGWRRWLIHGQGVREISLRADELEIAPDQRFVVGPPHIVAYYAGARVHYAHPEWGPPRESYRPGAAIFVEGGADEDFQRLRTWLGAEVRIEEEQLEQEREATAALAKRWRLYRIR